MIFEKPLFGFGPETFAAAIQPYLSPQIYKFEQLLALPNHPHNETIAAYLGQGFFGLAVLLSLFILLVVSAIKAIIKKNPNRRIIKYALATMIATVFTVQFSYLQITHIVLLIISAAIIAANTLPSDLNIRLKPLKWPGAILIIFITVFFGAKLIVTDHLLGSAMGSSFTDSKTAAGKFTQVLSINNLFAYPYDAAFTLLPQSLLTDKTFSDEYLKQYGRITNYNYQYYSAAGAIAYISNNPARAKACFERASILAPNSMRICSEYMSSAMSAGDIINAKAAAPKCWKLLPDFAQRKDLKALPPDISENDLELWLKSNPVYYKIMEVLNS